jgi:hypothetical protein
MLASLLLAIQEVDEKEDIVFAGLCEWWGV